MKSLLVALGIAAAVLASVGVVLAVLPAPSVSFGWSAFQPAGDFGCVGGAHFVPVSRLWGFGCLAVAAIIAAFVAGWVLGKARGGHAPGPASDERATRG
jgi:hypothetical protein